MLSKSKIFQLSVCSSSQWRALACSIQVNNRKHCPKDTKELLDEYGYGYGKKMLYNSKVEQIKLKLGFKSGFLERFEKKARRKKLQHILETTQPLPLSLKYYSGDSISKDENVTENITEAISSEMKQENMERKHTNFPLNITHSYNDEKDLNIKQSISQDDFSIVDEEIRKKYQLLKSNKNWMSAYENFEYDLNDAEENEMVLEDLSMNYGTSNPNSKISSVPCGGCGALLHCKDPAIPGYIPSEIFNNANRIGGASLEAIICQRCYFLKEHNLALDVQVSPEDYANVLMTISRKKALVIVIVDLTDFPCSIWPGIADILDSNTPIIIVGNKVDLLPKDDTRFLKNIKNNLLNNMRLFGFGSLKVLEVSLISAKTGYGVENLISSIFQKWNRVDVYLVGCTNVGKSTLFNTLLSSDLCKVQAKDLVQRATTSLWPGTTLNLLKFPILNPSHHRIYLRNIRLREMKKVNAEQEKIRNEQLKKINSVETATLKGYIGQTFGKKVIVNDRGDAFSILDRVRDFGKTKMGIDEADADYVYSKWCFDTPGVVQPDQILNILTADELMYVVPRELIRPQTFILKPGMTLFIAGLARLDLVDGNENKPVRFTVFRSNELPITICYTDACDNLYSDFLGTNFFKVPIDEGDRLSKWPGLELAKSFTITGIGWKESSKDVVLSSAGWIAVNCALGETYEFRAWTPEKRGVYIRDCLLPKAVTLRGDKIRNSVSYRKHKLI